MAGRPRKPTKLLEMSGAFRKNPDRKRPDEPQELRPLGDPPGRLPANAIAFWDELVDMVSGGVLTYRDRWAVEWAARLMEKSVREQSVETILELAREGELGAADIKAMVQKESISSAEMSILRSLLAALGMTPADRSKLSIPQKEKPVNRFSALAKNGA